MVLGLATDFALKVRTDYWVRPIVPTGWPKSSVPTLRCPAVGMKGAERWSALAVRPASSQIPADSGQVARGPPLPGLRD
jgi:hypothetical protein